MGNGAAESQGLQLAGRTMLFNLVMQEAAVLLGGKLSRGSTLFFWGKTVIDQSIADAVVMKWHDQVIDDGIS